MVIVQRITNQSLQIIAGVVKSELVFQNVSSMTYIFTVNIIKLEVN